MFVNAPLNQLNSIVFQPKPSDDSKGMNLSVFYFTSDMTTFSYKTSSRISKSFSGSLVEFHPYGYIPVTFDLQIIRPASHEIHQSKRNTQVGKATTINHLIERTMDRRSATVKHWQNYIDVKKARSTDPQNSRYSPTRLNLIHIYSALIGNSYFILNLTYWS